jgi:hypothetical protein
MGSRVMVPIKDIKPMLNVNGSQPYVYVPEVNRFVKTLA